MAAPYTGPFFLLNNNPGIVSQCNAGFNPTQTSFAQTNGTMSTSVSDSDSNAAPNGYADDGTDSDQDLTSNKLIGASTTAGAPQINVTFDMQNTAQSYSSQIGANTFPDFGAASYVATGNGSDNNPPVTYNLYQSAAANGSYSISGNLQLSWSANASFGGNGGATNTGAIAFNSALTGVNIATTTDSNGTTEVVATYPSGGNIHIVNYPDFFTNSGTNAININYNVVVNGNTEAITYSAFDKSGVVTDAGETDKATSDLNFTFSENLT